LAVKNSIKSAVMLQRATVSGLSSAGRKTFDHQKQQKAR